MKQVLITLSLLTALASTTLLGNDHSDDPNARTLAIIAGYEQPLTSETTAEMRKEIEKVVLVPDLNIVWRQLDASRSQEVFDHVLVARFRGSCGVADFPRLAGFDNVLGFTHLSDGVILPFVEVDCERVRGLLRREFRRRSQAVRELLLGRALARVLAHELYHVLAGTSKHSARGIAKAHMSPDDLVCDELAFEDGDLAKIRMHIFPNLELAAQPAVPLENRSAKQAE